METTETMRHVKFELRCFEPKKAKELNMYSTTGRAEITTLEGFLVFFIISALFVNIALFYINTQRMKIIQKQIRTLTDMDQANDIQEGDLREIVSTSRQNSKIPDDLKTNS